jgi:hypothetical protein
MASTGMTRTAARTPTVDEADCPSWFGPGIIALVCDEAAIQRALDDNTFGRVGGTVGIRTAAATKVGAATGLAQALGRRVLEPGEKIRLTGVIPKRGKLALRVATGKDRVALSWFSLEKFRRGTATLRLSGTAKRPALALELATGRWIKPRSVRVLRY